MSKPSGDLNLKLYKTITEGTYVRLQPQAAPSLFRILKDVCRILDYREAQLPEIYVYHAMDHTVRPCSADHTYIVMADYVLHSYDEDMLYYILGNAVTMILAGHVKMTTAAAYMGPAGCYCCRSWNSSGTCTMRTPPRTGAGCWPASPSQPPRAAISLNWGFRPPRAGNCFPRMSRRPRLLHSI